MPSLNNFAVRGTAASASTESTINTSPNPWRNVGVSRAGILQGVDVLALTGGIGEHDDQLRAELKDSLSWLCDMEILVIPADEEGMIARLCRRHCDAAVSAAIG